MFAFMLLLASGCSSVKPSYQQRFVPFPNGGDTPNMSFALDTKTGQTCITESKAWIDEETRKDTGNSRPFCYDLYKND